VEGQNNILLEGKNIYKSFPGVKALTNVSFDLLEGEVHILMGENGAGKSTLIKIFSGAYQADSGELLSFGKKLTINSPESAIACGIATSYQEFNLIDHLTVAENMYLGRMPHMQIPVFLDKGKMFSEAQKIIDDIGLDIDVHKKICELGVAQQQMVEIAKSLSMNARIYIMDEPTAALSNTEIDELFRVIRMLKSRKCGIIYISHRLEEIPQIGDRITVMRDGEKIDTVPADTDLDKLIEMMVGRPFHDVFPKICFQPGEELMRLEGLTRSKVFSDINLSLRAGEIVGLCGLVGSKRTEVLRAIYGADKISGGQIYLSGKPQKIKSPKQAVKAGVALLPEDRKKQGLVLIEDILDNMLLPSYSRYARFGLIDHKRAVSDATEVSKKISIKTPSLKQKTRNLSGGNQQKVVVARWLTSQCNIFLFDEPTRGIDVKAKREIYDLMNEIIKQGAGILMVSSELPEVMGICNKIYVMHHGRIVAQMDKSEYNQNKILKYALTGGDEVVKEKLAQAK
jgi:ribose transport system ATP-binding protein